MTRYDAADFMAIYDEGVRAGKQSWLGDEPYCNPYLGAEGGDTFEDGFDAGFNAACVEDMNNQMSVVQAVINYGTVANVPCSNAALQAWRA